MQVEFFTITITRDGDDLAAKVEVDDKHMVSDEDEYEALGPAIDAMMQRQRELRAQLRGVGTR